MGQRSKTARGTVHYLDSADNLHKVQFTVKFVEEKPAELIKVIVEIGNRKKSPMQMSWPKPELPDASDARRLVRQYASELLPRGAELLRIE